MDSPFNRYYNQPASGPRKVVTIPVHYVGTGRTRSESALAIQKAFRGYTTRKNLKKIVAIKAEVEEVEKEMEKEETLNSIRKEPRERVKINERLMSLLLKLDSVRGADPGVRDLRKAVIKKAIALQEAVDAVNQEEEVKEDVAGKEEEKERSEEGSMEENKKLMEMMRKLIERNEAQGRLLSSLSQRVEQLERAFLGERKRRKKLVAKKNGKRVLC